MRKIIIISSIVALSHATNYIDKKPHAITKNDLEIIKNFDNEINNIAEHKQSKILNINKVANYIYKNRRHAEDYTRLKIDTLGTAGYRTARGGVDSGASLVNPNNYNYYRVGITLTYNLFDPKTTIQIKNAKLQYKTSIITLVQKYATLKNKIYNLKEEIELDRLKQLRIKLMVKTAQKYLDDRVQILTKLLQDRETLTEQKVLLNATKEQLLNLVTIEAKTELKEML